MLSKQQRLMIAVYLIPSIFGACKATNPSKLADDNTYEPLATQVELYKNNGLADKSKAALTTNALKVYNKYTQANPEKLGNYVYSSDRIPDFRRVSQWNRNVPTKPQGSNPLTGDEKYLQISPQTRQDFTIDIRKLSYPERQQLRSLAATNTTYFADQSTRLAKDASTQAKKFPQFTNTIGKVNEDRISHANNATVNYELFHLIRPSGAESLE